MLLCAVLLIGSQAAIAGHLHDSVDDPLCAVCSFGGDRDVTVEQHDLAGVSEIAEPGAVAFPPPRPIDPPRTHRQPRAPPHS